MKLSDIQGKYTVVQNPTKLSELGGNYTTQPKPMTPNESSAALANSTHLVNGYGKPITENQNPTGAEKAVKENFVDPTKDVMTGIGKGAGSTLKSLGTMGSKIGDFLSGAVEKLGGPKDLFHSDDIYKPGTDAAKKAEEFLTPKSTAESVGKGAEQIGEFFIPAGTVGKVEKLLAGGAKTMTAKALIKEGLSPNVANFISKAASMGTKMAVRAAEGGAVLGLQTADPAQAKEGAKYGGIFAGAANLLKGVNVAGGFKRLAGALSGSGTSVIDEVVKDPKAALQGLTGESIDTLSKDSQKLKEAVIGMKEAAGKEHSRVINNLEEIFQNEGKSFDKGTEINKIKDTIAFEFNAVRDESGNLVFDSSKLLPKEANMVERALKIVESFKGPWTPKTIDELASKLDRFKSGSPSAILTDSAIGKMINSLRGSIADMGKTVGYAEGENIAKNYAIAMDKIDNFTRLFKATAEDLRPEATKIGVNSKTGEAVMSEGKVILPEVEKTNIINDLQTLFKGNKDVDKEVLRGIFGGQEILSREAGRTLLTAPEKASTKLGSAIRELVISPILSPATIGKIAANLSLAEPQVQKLADIIKKYPAAKAYFIETFAKLDEGDGGGNPDESYQKFLESLNQ